MNQSRSIPSTTLVSRTLWRIEAALQGAPSLNDLARAEAVSPFHLSRAFTLVIGQPVMAYVRARRLSEAARRLCGSTDSVLTIALDTGYESPEGFSRAFRDAFGVSPKAARDVLPQTLQEPIIMQPRKIPMPEPRIVDFNGRVVVGRKGRFTMDTRAKIPALWDSTAAEIGSKMYGIETFGVSYNFDADGFDYLVGMADDGDSDGLDRVVIPPHQYAVVDHAGHISDIAGTWQAIFDQWVPASGRVLGDGPEFERYAADFDVAKPGGVAVWVPVKG